MSALRHADGSSLNSRLHHTTTPPLQRWKYKYNQMAENASTAEEWALIAIFCEGAMVMAESFADQTAIADAAAYASNRALKP